MTRYAEKTTVSSDKSCNEIEQILARYGAEEFIYAGTRSAATIAFKIEGRPFRFILPMPDYNAREFTHTPSKSTRRQPEARLKEYEQAVRQRWRALALCIKAKLEAAAVGIVTLDQEFLAHMVLPGGRTIGDTIIPQLEHAIETGEMPKLLEM